MDPGTRRIVAVSVQRLVSGDCPVTIHSLGTGESFDIEPASDGFIDIASGGRVRIEADRIHLPAGGTIELVFDGGTMFSGHDPASGERFTGRAGGGATDTLYDATGERYFQYAVAGLRND